MKRRSAQTENYYDEDSAISFDYEERSADLRAFQSSSVENHLDAELAKKCKCNPYSHFTHAGPFILGQQLSDAQFIDLDQFLAKRADEKSPDRYYMLKIVTLPRNKNDETYSQRQAKLLVYNEYSVLSLLKDQEGVIHHYGLYMDYFYDNESSEASTPESGNSSATSSSTEQRGIAAATLETILPPNGRSSTDGKNSSETDHSRQHSTDHSLPPDCPSKGRLMRRIILALDCYISHIYCSTVYPLPKLFSKFTTVNSEYENLQEYVKRYKIIPEMKALLIFNKIVNIIYDLHQKNIAHRDLRLENILFSHRNEKIILINFGLARYVINDKICICDHRGSSAYISPDVLRRKPYNPKASDCWALGIIFYTMLFGKFPFYAETFPELFKKINTGQFSIPPNVLVWKNTHELQPLKTETHSIVISSGTVNIINSLIVTEAHKRMGVCDLRWKLCKLIEAKFKAKSHLESKKLVKGGKCINEDLQVVPDIDMPEYEDSMTSQNGGNVDDKLEAYFDLRTIAKDAATLIADSTKGTVAEANLLTNSSQIFSAMYESIEATLRNKRRQHRGHLDQNHLHDHTYSQMDHNSNRKSSTSSSEGTPNLFQNYLHSPEFRSSPRFISSTFSSHQNRFYLRSGQSMYETKNKNYTSLLLESGFEQARKRYKSRNNFSKAGGSGTNLRLRSPTSGFIRHASKAKSNFSVIKMVDGDIRPLSESERNLAQSFLQSQ